jgi:hypothetical protein
VKSSKVEACIICDDIPCSCDTKKSKPRVKKTRAILCGPAAPTAEDLKVVEEFGQLLRNRFANTKKAEAPSSGLDFETEQAIRNLANAGLITDVDKVKYRNVISPRPSNEIDRRLADWRKRNALA